MKLSNKAKKWIRATLVRSIKTVAETALAIIGSNTFGITDVDWVGLVSTCLLSGVITILTCSKGLPEVQ